MPKNIDELNEDLDSADKIRAGLKGDDDTTDNTSDDVDVDDNPAKQEPKITDNEAKLIKDLMKYKNASKKSADELKALRERFDGIDIDAVREMLNAKEEAENAALEKKGEYERLLAKQRDAANAQINDYKSQADAANEKVSKLLSQIEDLTTGSAFSNSKFVNERLTLTPNKAKALYKSHFEFQEGRMVAYDKPAGEANRTMIVDATGEAVDFESAIASIIDADPDKDYLLKAEQKAGSASKPTNAVKPPKQQEYVDTTDKIAAGLDIFIKSQPKK